MKFLERDTGVSGTSRPALSVKFCTYLWSSKVTSRRDHRLSCQFLSLFFSFCQDKWHEMEQNRYIL